MFLEKNSSFKIKLVKLFACRLIINTFFFILAPVKWNNKAFFSPDVKKLWRKKQRVNKNKLIKFPFYGPRMWSITNMYKVT